MQSGLSKPSLIAFFSPQWGGPRGLTTRWGLTELGGREASSYLIKGGGRGVPADDVVFRLVSWAKKRSMSFVFFNLCFAKNFSSLHLVCHGGWAFEAHRFRFFWHQHIQKFGLEV